MESSLSKHTRLDGHTQSSPCSAGLSCSAVAQRGDEQHGGDKVREDIQALPRCILTLKHCYMTEAEDPLQHTSQNLLSLQA